MLYIRAYFLRISRHVSILIVIEQRRFASLRNQYIDEFSQDFCHFVCIEWIWSLFIPNFILKDWSMAPWVWLCWSIWRSGYAVHTCARHISSSSFHFIIGHIRRKPVMPSCWLFVSAVHIFVFCRRLSTFEFNLFASAHKHTHLNKSCSSIQSPSIIQSMCKSSAMYD